MLVLLFMLLEVSPVFSVVFLVLHLGHTRAGKGQVTTGHPWFFAESQRPTLFSFFLYFLALRLSLSQLDCTDKSNHDNSLCLMSASYILFQHIVTRYYSTQH